MKPSCRVPLGTKCKSGGDRIAGEGGSIPKDPSASNVSPPKHAYLFMRYEASSSRGHAAGLVLPAANLSHSFGTLSASVVNPCRSCAALGRTRRPIRSVHCNAGSLWLVESVAEPGKTLGAVLGYGLFTGILVLGANFALRTLLWDYQNRRTDDPQRPHDLQADVGLSLADMMILGLEENDDEDSLLLTSEERRKASSARLGLSFSKLLTSNARASRQFCALALGMVAVRVLEGQSLDPRIQLQLLTGGSSLALQPVKADWSKPIGPLLLPADAMEGLALYLLNSVLLEDVRLLVRVAQWVKAAFRELKGVNDSQQLSD